jgi:hypothetical protein
MQVNVMRSDLLRFYYGFLKVSPATLSNVYLTVSPGDFFLLAKVISSALNKKIVLDIQYDDQLSIHSIYASETLDKNVLQSVLDSMDQQSLLHHDGLIHLKLMHSLSVVILLETLLSKNNALERVQPHQEYLVFKKLYSIRKKLGYSNFCDMTVQKALPSLRIGDVAIVADDSGAKEVRVVSEVAPMIYIVNILKTKFGNDFKFPPGKKYAAVLIQNLLQDCNDFSNEVCLFEYYGGLTQPLFTSVVYNGAVFPKTVLNFKHIVESCSFM